MRPELERGAALFGAGEYWEAHEAWEPPWLAARARGDAQGAHYVQGLILLAAALHKARAHQNPRGGRLNLEKARRHLAQLPDDFGSPDGLASLERLIAETEGALEDGTTRPQL